MTEVEKNGKGKTEEKDSKEQGQGQGVQEIKRRGSYKGQLQQGVADFNS